MEGWADPYPIDQLSFEALCGLIALLKLRPQLFHIHFRGLKSLTHVLEPIRHRHGELGRSRTPIPTAKDLAKLRREGKWEKREKVKKIKKS